MLAAFGIGLIELLLVGVLLIVGIVAALAFVVMSIAARFKRHANDSEPQRFALGRVLLIIAAAALVLLIAMLVLIFVLGIVLRYTNGYAQVDMSLIDDARKTYLATEGHNARGTKFYELVSQLDSPAIPGKHVTGRLFTTADIAAMLGPPDMVRRSATSTDWIYFWDRFGKNDWFVMVTFDANDPYAEFGYNASSTLNLSQRQTYQSVDEPAPGEFKQPSAQDRSKRND